MGDTVLERVAHEIAMEISELTAVERRQMVWPDDFNGDTIERARACAAKVIEVIWQQKTRRGE
jgi:hypothetical protein